MSFERVACDFRDLLNGVRQQLWSRVRRSHGTNRENFPELRRTVPAIRRRRDGPQRADGLALQRGVPLLQVSRQLGHASIAITADVYGHLAPDAGQEVAAAWEAILTAPGRNPRATPAHESG